MHERLHLSRQRARQICRSLNDINDVKPHALDAQSRVQDAISVHEGFCLSLAAHTPAPSGHRSLNEVTICTYRSQESGATDGLHTAAANGLLPCVGFYNMHRRSWEASRLGCNCTGHGSISISTLNHNSQKQTRAPGVTNWINNALYISLYGATMLLSLLESIRHNAANAW